MPALSLDQRRGFVPHRSASNRALYLARPKSARARVPRVEPMHGGTHWQTPRLGGFAAGGFASPAWRWPLSVAPPPPQYAIPAGEPGVYGLVTQTGIAAGVRASWR